jgi:PII-like signaling protein
MPRGRNQGPPDRPRMDACNGADVPLAMDVRLTITLPEAACRGGRSACRQLLQRLRRQGFDAVVVRHELGWLAGGRLHVPGVLELPRHNLVSIEVVGDRARLQPVVDAYLPRLGAATVCWQPTRRHRLT